MNKHKMKKSKGVDLSIVAHAPHFTLSLYVAHPYVTHSN